MWLGGTVAQFRRSFECWCVLKSAGTFLRRDGELLVTWLNIPSALQPKLLRIVQEQQFERLGSTRTHQVDVRLVDATNRDLGEMAKQGDFRGDLYHRLNVFPLSAATVAGAPRRHSSSGDAFCRQPHRRNCSSANRRPPVNRNGARRQ